MDWCAHVLLHVGGNFFPLSLHITSHPMQANLHATACSGQSRLQWTSTVCLVRDTRPPPHCMVGAADWPLRTAVVVFQHNVGVGAAFTAAGAVDPPVNALTLFVRVLTHSAHAQSTCALYHALFTDCCDVCSFADFKSHFEQAEPYSVGSRSGGC